MKKRMKVIPTKLITREIMNEAEVESVFIINDVIVDDSDTTP